MDLEPFLGILGMRRENSLSFTHTFTPTGNEHRRSLYQHVFGMWEETGQLGGNSEETQETWRERVQKLKTNSNWSSGMSR